MPSSFLFCTACHQKYPFSTAHPRCSACNEPLDVECRPANTEIFTEAGTLLERFRNFLPLDQIHPELSLGEGNTPLVRSSAAATALGLERLFFKNETLNPTWSFKDRGTIAGLEHAIALGYRKIGTVSTGNMAASVAAYGARSGLETFILVSSDLPREKIAPIAVYGPRLITVDGNYGDLYFRSLEAGAQNGIYFINSDVPFRIEGSKTIAFEICLQLEFSVPDYLVVPVSAGGNLRGIIKGFEEFLQAGLIDRLPCFVAAQASGCSPIADAFISGRDTVERVEKPNTIARAIGNPYPPSGNQTLRKLREHGGLAVKVSDQDILAARDLLAHEGIFGQPAAAAPLAATRQLVDSQTIKLSDRVVCLVSGAGFKYMAALKDNASEITSTDIDNLEIILASL